MPQTRPRLFGAFQTDRNAVTAIEYALIAALIGAVIVSALTAAGGAASTTFETIGNTISPSNSSASSTVNPDATARQSSDHGDQNHWPD